MKAILEFSLPEESHEFELATSAGRMGSVIEETLNHIRSRLKYGGLTHEAFKELEEVREILLEAV